MYFPGIRRRRAIFYHKGQGNCISCDSEFHEQINNIDLPAFMTDDSRKVAALDCLMIDLPMKLRVAGIMFPLSFVIYVYVYMYVCM